MFRGILLAALLSGAFACVSNYPRALFHSENLAEKLSPLQEGNQVVVISISADQSCMKRAVLDFSAAMKSGFHERIDDATHQTTNGTKVNKALKAAFTRLQDNFHKSTHEFSEEYLACSGKKWLQKHACFLGAAGAVTVKIAMDVGSWTLNELPQMVTSAGNNVGEHAKIAGTLGLNLVSMTAACAWQLTIDLKNCI